MQSPAFRPGDFVDTRQGGPGVVRNVVTSHGRLTAVIVQLDDDHDRQPLWRTYDPSEVTRRAPA